MDAEGLGYAGAEAIGLNERSDERANVIYAGAIDKITKRFNAGLAGAHFEIHEVEFLAEIGMGMMQIDSDPHQGLIEGESGFNADDSEIESVGQGNADASLAVFVHSLQKEARDEKAQGRATNDQWQVVEDAALGQKNSSAETHDGQRQARAKKESDVARFAKPGLDEPCARSRNIGRRQGDCFAERIERLLDSLSYFERRLFLRCSLTAEGAQAGAQHGTWSHRSSAESEYYPCNGNEDDDGQDQRHSQFAGRSFIPES